MTIKKKRLAMDIAHLERQATHDYKRAETEDSEEMRRLVITSKMNRRSAASAKKALAKPEKDIKLKLKQAFAH